MKLIYIAGPFRGSNQWQIAENVHRAMELASQAVELGVMPVCPHGMTRDFHGHGDDELWLEGTMELMRRCDAVLLTPDWRRSTGATLERQEALRLGLPVFDNVIELRDWLEAMEEVG